MPNFIKRIGVSGLILASLASSVSAQSIVIGPNGARIEDSRNRDDHEGDRFDDRRDRQFDRRPERDVSEREAVRIAGREGVREVDDGRRSRTTVRVDGVDRRKRNISVVIDRRSGDVLSVRPGRV